MPRPRKNPAEIETDNIVMIEELASYGLNYTQISAVLGINEKTLRRYKKTDEDVKSALLRGQAKASMAVGKALLERATEGDVPAIRWWEMTRDGRSEKQSQKHEGSVKIIRIPETQTVEEWNKGEA